MDQHGSKYHVKLDGASATTCTVTCTKNGKVSTLRAMIRLIAGIDCQHRVVWGFGMIEEYDLDMTRASTTVLRWNHAHRPNRVFEWKRIEESAGAPPPAPQGAPPPAKAVKGRRYTPLDVAVGATAAPAASTAKLAPWCRDAATGPRAQPSGWGLEESKGEAPCQKVPGAPANQGTGPSSSSDNESWSDSGNRTDTSTGCMMQAQVPNDVDQTFHIPKKVQGGQVVNPDQNQEFFCRICLDLCGEPAVLPCSHLFCKACLQTVVEYKGSRKVQCPACRAEFAKEDCQCRNNELGLIRRMLDSVEVCCAFAPISALPDTADDPLPRDHAARKLGISCPWVGQAGAYRGHVEGGCMVAGCVRQLDKVVRDGPEGEAGEPSWDWICVTRRPAQVSVGDRALPIPVGTPCLVTGGRGEAANGNVEVEVIVLWLDHAVQPSHGWTAAAAFLPESGDGGGQPMKTRRDSDEKIQASTGYLTLAAGEDVQAYHFEWDGGTQMAWFYGHSTRAPDNWGWFAADTIQWHLGNHRAATSRASG